MSHDALLNQASKSFSETRAFLSSSQLLGYFEGRPGVQELLTVWPMRAGEQRERFWTRAQRAEALARLESTDIAADVAEEKGAAAAKQWTCRVLQAAEWADDGGIVTEVEVSGDSGGSDGD